MARKNKAVSNNNIPQQNTINSSEMQNVQLTKDVLQEELQVSRNGRGRWWSRLRC